MNLTHAHIISWRYVTFVYMYFAPPPQTPTIFFRRMGFRLFRFITQGICMPKKSNWIRTYCCSSFVLSLYVILFSWSIIAFFDILLEQLRQKEQEIRELKDLYLEKSFITDEGRVSLVMTRKGILITIRQSL